MKKYIKHFSVFLIPFVMVLIALIACMILHKDTPDIGYVRSNTQCLTEERVFDYADVLTDAEEFALRNLIAEKEDEIGCDIVLVTMSDPDVNTYYSMMNYADDFYDNNKFGYNEPWGDGALYLDNFLGVGNSLSWFSTCGRVEDKYSESMIDSLIDSVCSRVNDDPYGAYVGYIESLSRTMSYSGSIEPVEVPVSGIFGFAAIVTLIYIVVCVNRNVGKKTVTSTTYVAGGHPDFLDKRDIFLSKHTTTRRIETSSSSGGGGGHHISSGGHSHGGGGGRH